MADHVHGTMDTSAQEKTYEGFIKASVRSVVAIIVVLIIMALLGA
ncbi:aa3-type cytochrome c oxidase subunit IV [Aliiroseovarius marinus]